MEKRQIKAAIGIFTICTILFLSLICFVPNESWGAEKPYPNRLINVVVGYAPGATDTYTRPYIELMAEYLGQPMTYVYKPGAGGSIGFSFVSKAKPDGYTLLGCSTGPVITGPLTTEGIDYTYDSFATIARFCDVPVFLAVKADSPFKTVDDIVAAAKAAPGKLSFSSSGVFSSTHFAMELFKKSYGVDLTHVPCQGGGPSVTAFLGGHVSFMASDIGPLAPHVAAGTVRLLALMDDKRIPAYQNIPTFGELGHPDVVWALWYGLIGPKGLSKEIIDTVFGAAKKVDTLKRNEIETQFKKLGVFRSFLNPEEFDKANREHIKSVKELLKTVKLTK
jgi:tripartite-type tricarboxylate transporter receptor subunit TctC